MDKVAAKKIESFFTQFKHQQYKKGEILMRADDTPSGIFYLKQGIVKQYHISKKGEEVVLNIYKLASFFPMSWAINNTPNIYFYEAMLTTEVWKAPKEKAVEFLKNNPDVSYNLLSRVYSGLEGLFLRMAYLMGGSAYARLIIEIIILAKRFGKKKGRSVEVLATEKDLAAFTGMTRETVSRELAILKKKDLLSFNRHRLFIKDLGKLEAYASSS